MSGKVVNTLVMCGDDRLKEAENQIIREHIKRSPYRWTRPGGVMQLLEAKLYASFLSDISIGFGRENKSLWKIFLMNHEDCKAYKGKKVFKSRKEEKEFHKEELRRAKNVLLEVFSFSNPIVKTFYAELVLGTNDKFIVIEIMA